MPRPKGSKNKPKTADKTTVVSTVDYTELIEEKLDEKNSDQRRDHFHHRSAGSSQSSVKR